jgi:hypothetical protein
LDAVTCASDGALLFREVFDSLLEGAEAASKLLDRVVLLEARQVHDSRFQALDHLEDHPLADVLEDEPAEAVGPGLRNVQTNHQSNLRQLCASRRRRRRRRRVEEG